MHVTLWQYYDCVQMTAPTKCHQLFPGPWNVSLVPNLTGCHQTFPKSNFLFFMPKVSWSKSFKRMFSFPPFRKWYAVVGAGCCSNAVVPSQHKQCVWVCVSVCGNITVNRGTVHLPITLWWTSATPVTMITYTSTTVSSSLKMLWRHYIQGHLTNMYFTFLKYIDVF